VRDLAMLGVRKEIFLHRGEPFHEIAFIDETRLSPDALEALDGVAIVEDDDDVEIARVVSIAHLREGRFAPRYPTRVVELLD
jgi:hypothetical protein